MTIHVLPLKNVTFNQLQSQLSQTAVNHVIRLTYNIYLGSQK